MRTDPSVLHLQDIKVPRNKVARVRRNLLAKYPLFTPFFNVSANANGPGLCTMVRNEYTPGLSVLNNPDSLDGRLLCISIQGFGATRRSTLINTYQHVNTPHSLPLATELLESVYKTIRKAQKADHNALWTGDLNAVLAPCQRHNYAQGTSLDMGDSLLQRMAAKMGATNTPEHNSPTWRSKTGEQLATLDHILVFPPDLRVVKGGCFFLEDTRFDHAARWILVNGNDLGFPIAPDQTRTPFKPQIQRRNWTKSKQVVTTLMDWEKPNYASLSPPPPPPHDSSSSGSSEDSPSFPSSPSSMGSPITQQEDISAHQLLLSDIHVN